MRVALISLPVIMLLRFVLCSDDIEDLSDWCSNGRKLYHYLTSGAGSTDKFVSMIATAEKINCTLKFSVKPKNYVMVVLEFPDMKGLEKVCFTEKSNSILVRDYTATQTCPKRSILEGSHHRLSKDDIVVDFRSDGEMSTVKVTATSMRAAVEVKCNQVSETECVVGDNIYCMTRETMCDGHNNCGNLIDERHCNEPPMSFFVIFSSLVMTLLTLCLLLSIVMCMVPRRKEPYIHSFDQTMSLFDSGNGIVTVELNIITLFPEPKQSQPKQTRFFD